MFRLPVVICILSSLLTFTATAHADPGGHNRNFRAHLSGDQETSGPDTLAQGEIVFQLSKDGSELAFMLIVANIEDVFMAHIHLAPQGENGPIAVWLYPSEPPSILIPGRSDGILAVGTILEEDLVGPLTGMSMDDLVSAMREGLAYVNVHTIDFPGGEIRGQIED